MTADIHETVRLHYAEAARDVLQGTSCCSDEGSYGSQLYSALEREELPDAAVLASLGCGNPMMVADLHEGERVLDLGSGGGIDVLLSARRVGPAGRAFGLDMTDEMLTLARQNAATAGATNVEFLKGHIEEIPLPAASIDVVISNCVVNLAADKPAVFREIARVLRPGGRIGIADILADNSLTPEKRAELGSYAGCIAGALSFAEYRDGLAAAGISDVAITVSHELGGGMFSALVKATKPAAGAGAGGVGGGAGATGASGASGAGESGASGRDATAAPVPAGTTVSATQADCCGAGCGCGGAAE